MNKITFYFVVLLSWIWFLISYFYISLEIYDLSDIPVWEYKILTFREKVLEYCLLIWMFIFWIYLGRNLSSADIKGISWRPKVTIKDNLTKIEWISPGIEYILNQRWLRTYKDISNITLKEIEEILYISNVKDRDIYSDTWSEQASLACSWKWKELKEYKYFIVEGRA